MRKPIAAMIVLLVVASSTIIAFASIPSANGVIHGCFRRSDGRLRVINAEAGRTCLTGERSLSWNQRGRRGLRGLRGPRGIQGIQGEQGIQGPQGEPGLTSPAVTYLAASSNLAISTSHTLSWTQPSATTSRLFWRLNVVTPGGLCENNVEAAILAFDFWINDVDSEISAPNMTMAPSETRTNPIFGSFTIPDVFLPGEYEFRTDIEPLTVNPGCEDIVVETEFFVETVASA